VIAESLFAPLIEGRLPSGWRLLTWDFEQGLCLTLEHGRCTLLVELEERDDARGCHARTARFNINIRHVFDSGARLDDEERRFVEAVIDLVRRREGMLPVVERPPTTRASAVREISVERALMPEGPGHYYFNPYVGCMIGCPFCYVQERADFSRRLEGLPRLEWGRYVDVKVNAAEVLRREVKTHPPGIVRMSPILTDPYQPIERRYRITRQALEVFLEAGFVPVILTRGARVVEDLDLLRRFQSAAVGFSIPTDVDSVRAAFEPGADPVEERFDALAACHEAGLRTFAVIQPMLPMNPRALVETLAPIVRVARIDRMQEVARYRHLYESAGMLHALEPAFFEATATALREGFERRGVAMDEMDDLGALVGRS
jgi:DNA repair photolyase